MFCCGIGGTLTGITLIDPGKLDCVVGNGLDGTREPLHLAAVFCASGCDMKRQQIAQRVDGHVDLRTLLALPTVIAGTLAALGRGTQRPTIDDCRGRFGLTTAARRSTARRSSTSASKHPAASHRCVCWYTAAQGGRSFGIHRHGAPVFTM
jgi:hypothetical protein